MISLTRVLRLEFEHIGSIIHPNVMIFLFFINHSIHLVLTIHYFDYLPSVELSVFLIIFSKMNFYPGLFITRYYFLSKTVRKISEKVLLKTNDQQP